MKTEIKIKPLSVNQAWKGRRFRTDKYRTFQNNMLYLLPNSIKIDSKARLKLSIEFCFSSRACDIDNALKTFIDCLVKKYGFDDRNIYELHVIKSITDKGNEHIVFEITEL